jgi:SMODS domain-containing protein
MAATAPQAFGQFASQLTLTHRQRLALRDRKDRIRNLLTPDWAIENVIFGGSHARGSKIRQAGGTQGDVDIYVVLNSNERNYGGLFQPVPAQLLRDIKKTLDRSLRTPRIRADSPAVRVTYEDMIVDVVPAFRRLLSDAYDVPYYRGWMKATPRAQERLFQELNRARAGKLKPFLRMLKYWKAIHRSVGLRSYHLETLAYEIFRRHPIDDYRLAFYTFFSNAQTMVQWSWNDPGGSGNRVTDYFNTEMASRATRMFRHAAIRAERAIDAKTWRQEIAIWRSPLMLGSRFPAYTGR